MPEFDEVQGVNGTEILSVALIGPDETRRKAIASVLDECPGMRFQEYSSFPNDIDETPKMLEEHHDIVIVDLDGDPETALDAVVSICDDGSQTVMVFAEQADQELMSRCMRAGARELLVLPITAADMAGALARVSVHLPGIHPARRKAGHLCVFLGSKGGCGVTTIASNFAVLLAQESGKKTLLIDLGIPLGDVAINFGIDAKFSTDDAFQDSSRLDASFLSSLLAKHSAGLYILAATGEFPKNKITVDAVDKLLAVARQSFDYVVVDAGFRPDLKDSALLDSSATIYLVAQVDISELRNANRLISQFFASRGNKLQIVLNRCTPHLFIDDEHIAKALTRPAQWKIPDDHASARRIRDAATSLVSEDSPIPNAIRRMARKACGLPEGEEKKKKGFSLFGRSR